jgi:hypothetical protein
MLVAGYLGLFALLQSPALWYPLRPDPARSLFPDLFRPVNEIFSDWWVNLDRTDESALLMVPVYLAVLAVVTGPLIYLLRYLSLPGVLRSEHRGPLLRRVLGSTAAVMLALLFLRGLLSTDIYSYIWYARIWVLHGSSPFTHAPSEFPPDPEGAIHWAGWQDETSVYGPAWLAISAGSFNVGEILGGSFAAQVLVFKLLANAAHLLNACLVWSIVGLYLGRHKPARPWPLVTRPSRLRRLHFPRRLHALHGRGVTNSEGGTILAAQAVALIFYAWNPLLLIEFAGSGHNDVVMITFVLLAIWLHLKGRWPLAALLLAVAALTKLPALIFIPGYLWLLLWERAKATGEASGVRRMGAGVTRVVQALAIMVAAAALLYAPFWEGPATLSATVSGPASRLFLHSIASDIWWNAPTLVIDGLDITGGQEEEIRESIWRFLDENLRWVLLGIFAMVAVAVTWGARTFRRAAEAWGWVAIAAAMTQGWFWPWYVAWAVAPAAVAQSGRLRITTLIFSISALLLYLEEQVLSHHFVLFKEWSGAFIVLPPLIYLSASWLTETVKGRRKGTVKAGNVTNRQPRRLNKPQPTT